MHTSNMDFIPTTTKYTVRFFNTAIETTVTNQSTTITAWLRQITSRLHRATSTTLVGLDVECRPHPIRHLSNKSATLQLCVDYNCLIIQLFYIANPNFTFVGIEVGDDLTKLKNEYGLASCGNYADIRAKAKDRWPGRFSRPGLKDLAYDVCGMMMSKARHVTMSNWDARVLSVDQVEYACIDAFASYKIGHKVLVEIYDCKYQWMLGNK